MKVYDMYVQVSGPAVVKGKVGTCLVIKSSPALHHYALVHILKQDLDY